LWVFAALAAAAVLGYLFWRVVHEEKAAAPLEWEPEVKFSGSSPRVQLQQLERAGCYSGVMIETHCKASSPLAGRKFPIGEVPELPVAGCEVETCTCRYIGLRDRRVDDRRKLPDRRKKVRMEEDRRSGEDRRKDANRWRSEYDL
jgi:hypothetical protein